ncbi:transcription initiation factor IID, 31kD subunit-domain-containing protein [Aspergillus pseudonomiae]|uniref:Transcription initiation factor IID, 31kD subunit-domain-containing protein n=1 Tax=Aspergillus pseudonomiae TaxID=1506151 RepID=A0A5N7CRN0_9EURO|nr:transcription initiation factor IID, 31kD subunit-domain-containing protein [Aspergillus pseudonomiae]KAE8396846.1 transcription initiation factor IID, 31kD subunit-domain-containing protein [Aspergillus pseudonomiae]
MASPNQSQTAAPSTQPLTPPAEPSNTTTTTTTNNASSQQQQPATGSSTTSAPVAQPTQVPSTSLKDSGKSRRPRDVRLIHMLLASLGVTSYQERVPLQLLDFAYRYTSGVLQDAVHLATEGYAGAVGEQAGSARGPPEVNTVSLPALRLSIASRLHYQFQTGLPKEFLMDVAAERNRVALPGATRGYDQGQAKPAANQSVLMGGMRLPPERFCLTGVGWNMKDEWESEGEEEVEEEEEPKENNHAGAGGEEEGDGGEEDEDGKMEDIFGEDAVMGDGDGDDDGDKDMTDV